MTASLPLPRTTPYVGMLAALCLTTGLFATQVLAGETTNKIGVTMVDIPAGSFVMGSCKRIELTSEH